VTKGNPEIGVASVGASPRGLPHPWEPVGWPDFLEAGLSYRASRGLLAGELGGRAAGPIQYALHEPGGVL
jgi:hypothetical protein